MRHLPGWLVGALGTSALVGAFYAGGHAAARTPTGVGATALAAAPVEDIGDGLVDTVAPPARLVTRVSSPARVVSGPAPIDNEPLEVYRPRVVRTSYPPAASTPTRLPDVAARPDAPPRRSWQRSAIIIGSSAAVAATVGGLAKGKKGALIGGIVGGGAATVWDQMTRRKSVGDR